MVVAGDTVVLPAAATVPMPLSIEIDVAFDTFQLMVADPPGDIVPGAAKNEVMIGVGPDGAPPSVTVILSLISSDQLPVLSCTLK